MNIPATSILQRTLYDPWFEHDGCGIGFVARISGEASHDILHMALAALCNLEHRGAVAADALTGDGAGVLTQIPRAFFMRQLEQNQAADPSLHIDAADLAVGMLFLPQDTEAAEMSCRIITQELADRGLHVVGWRDVPTNDASLGQRAQEMKPHIRQVFIGRSARLTDDVYERTLYLARKAMEAAFRANGLNTYIPSLSSRSIVYKGLLMGSRLGEFYADLTNPEYATALAVYHARYSTNTFPAWERAQPFRMISHNGEINTLQGNVNWIRAREKRVKFPTEGVPTTNGSHSAALITPVVDETGSDSAMFDNVLELLVHGGRDIRHAMTMMAPEAWEKIPGLDPNLRAFYLYHACLMEPWDGPAALTFSDGRIVGTSLDRNGLRPSRYRITDDGLVISGSEAGVVPIDSSRIIHKGNLGPGQMIAVDTMTGRFYTNEEIKRDLSTQQPYSLWIDQHLTFLDDEIDGCKLNRSCSSVVCEQPTPVVENLPVQQMAFGYTKEELNVILKPMFRDGKEPVGAMGDDTPMAVLTQYELGRPLFQFFKQRFAEVTNPPIDPLREELVMSLCVTLGRRGDLLYETPEHAHLLRLTSPVITDAQLTAIRANTDPYMRSATLSTLMPVETAVPGANGVNGHKPVTNGRTPAAPEEKHAGPLQTAIARLCEEAEQAVNDGAAILILSDRGVDALHAPIPSLLALGAVHHHLIRTGLRGSLSLIVESGEPREVHHVACLVGYGAKAVNPYLALESVREMAGVTPAQNRTDGDDQPQNGTGAAEHLAPVRFIDVCGSEAEQNFIQAMEKGIFKIMSKMGISPLESYCGAQIFEAVGISQELIDACFTGTPSRIGGISFEKLEQDVLVRHRRAFGGEAKITLPHPGFYKFKKDGEHHTFSPAVVHAIHDAVRYTESEDGRVTGEFLPEGYRRYRKYADMVNNRPPSEPRDLMEFVAAGTPIPLDEVEPIEAIVKRFSTAAMSHGALSSEAHETLAIAMNRLGGKSNSGEGGEAPERYVDDRKSRIKQVASGRFGVTPAYLANADMLQIKMAQGSKPGEGGQLPGHKVSPEIARNRHTVPGVSLISPPPHHDIYSIEDLAQLIYDLKETNPEAMVSVKLVATAGVGTIAAGVAKGYADSIHISGNSGGTGASPLSSIKNAGIAWELGLAETQQTLLLNGLRERVNLSTDGGFQSGRDVVIAAMLGADEFSFGTIAMVAEGCVMARVCHANTCPVGVATQRTDLRAKFPGTPEMVMAFFRYMAQEIREILASLGLRSLDEAVGRTDLLHQKQTHLPGADLLDLSPVLVKPVVASTSQLRYSGQRNMRPEDETINDHLLRDAKGALTESEPVELNYTISNRDRTVGARLAGAIGQMHGDKGLPAGTIRIALRGSAGQSFGAFNAPGMHLTLIGEANDYVGKGMAGGEIVIRPFEHSNYAWRENTIAGNTILYGATGGEIYLAGRVGERFAVRNSGAVVVVEGTGDHACEYMTGGTVVILGPTGRNLGAGMTGGVAYVLDEAGHLPITYNPQLVQLDRLNPQEESRLQALIQRHLERTSSPFAAELLNSWHSYIARFWRVMPREAVAKIEAASEGTTEIGKPEKVAAAPVPKHKEPVAG